MQPRWPGDLPRRERRPSGPDGPTGRWRTATRVPGAAMVVPGLCLGGALALSVRHPSVAAAAAAATAWLLWLLWLVYPGRGRRGAGRGGGAIRLALRYLGGHPALPTPGPACLTVWPAEGGATLRVGRTAVAFPLAAVQSVALADGRVELATGARGWAAAVLGRLLAWGTGRYCGLRRTPRQDLAVVDRSRVVVDLVRAGGPCRLVLVGPRGGGEEVYLETLVMLRPSDAWRGARAPGGTRDGSTVEGGGL
jgi:hypothetical protein